MSLREETQGKVLCEIEVIEAEVDLQAKECQALLAILEAKRKAQNSFGPWASEESMVLQTPCFWTFEPPELWEDQFLLF